MWNHLDKILYVLFLLAILYSVAMISLILWRLISKKNIPLDRLQKIRIVINRLVPFAVLLSLLAYLTTINVPINFMIIILILLIFWKQLKCYAFGIVLPLFRKIEVGNEILVPFGKGIIKSLKPLGIIVQSKGALIHVGYDVLLDQPLMISKNDATKQTYELTLIDEQKLKEDQAKENLLAILSNTALIDHHEIPEITDSIEPNIYHLKLHLESGADLSDIKYLLIEKGFTITQSIQKSTT
ncbi:MAG TPA: hypothetical protein PKD18_02940 [Saprospiraceae bacterium]|nr:hypothetical protein [Saprospiraceae bacterium]